MKNITRRIAAGAVLIAAPALIGLGTATASQAQGSLTNNGPSISHPVPRTAFPNQGNIPKPGSREHHQHQKMRELRGN